MINRKYKMVAIITNMETKEIHWRISIVYELKSFLPDRIFVFETCVDHFKYILKSHWRHTGQWIINVESFDKIK